MPQSRICQKNYSANGFLSNKNLCCIIICMEYSRKTLILAASDSACDADSGAVLQEAFRHNVECAKTKEDLQ